MKTKSPRFSIWCLAHWLQFQRLSRTQWLQTVVPALCTTATFADLPKHRCEVRPAKHVKLWRNLATANYSTSPTSETPATPATNMIDSPPHLAPFHTLAWMLPQLKEKPWHGAPVASIFVGDSPSLTRPALALPALQTHPGSKCRWFIVWAPGDSWVPSCTHTARDRVFFLTSNQSTKASATGSHQWCPDRSNGGGRTGHRGTSR